MGTPWVQQVVAGCAAQTVVPGLEVVTQEVPVLATLTIQREGRTRGPNMVVWELRRAIKKLK